MNDSSCQSEISIIIKTFERTECLLRLLASIDKAELGCPVLIADDSRVSSRDFVLREYGHLDIRYIDLPYDVGASTGRNALVREVETKYFLLCDDDFIFDKRTNAALLVDLLQKNDIDILGALPLNRPLLIENDIKTLTKTIAHARVRLARDMLLWRMNNSSIFRSVMQSLLPEVPWRFYGHFHIEAATCYLRLLSDHDYIPPLVACDFVPQFFLAITKAIVANGVFWDEQLRYYGEHLDFFFRAKKAGLKVAMTKEVSVIHQRVKTKDYVQGRDDRPLMMRKNGLKEILVVDELPGSTLRSLGKAAL